MLTVPQFAAMVGLDVSRIRLLCTQGRIRGAVKVGRNWILPDRAVILPPKGTPAKRKQPPSMPV